MISGRPVWYWFDEMITAGLRLVVTAPGKCTQKISPASATGVLIGLRAGSVLQRICSEVRNIFIAPIIADIQACATGGGQVVQNHCGQAETIHRWKRFDGLVVKLSCTHWGTFIANYTKHLRRGRQACWRRPLRGIGGSEMLLLELLELIDTPGMPAFAERGGQKHADDLADFVFVEQVGAEA